jgi:hypothetical protein
MYKVKQNEVLGLDETLAGIETGNVTIVNDLTTGGTTSVLSAEQGKTLETQMNTKLTATKATLQANSTATDIAGLVSDFNALLAKLKTAGIMANS